MDKTICFLHIMTNDEHNISMEYPVIKKQLYCYERLISLEYEIGAMHNNKYIIKQKDDYGIEPRCFILKQELSNSKRIDPEELILKLQKILNNINIIVCNNAQFTLNTLLAEAIRYNIKLEFNKFIIIDIKEITKIEHTILETIKKNFFDLYNNI